MIFLVVSTNPPTTTTPKPTTYSILTPETPSPNQSATTKAYRTFNIELDTSEAEKLTADSDETTFIAVATSNSLRFSILIPLFFAIL